MVDTSPKFGFNFLSGEAQDETLHNENVRMIQAILQGVEDKDLSTPPGGPSDGDSYIVGSSPTGDWSGRANSIAIYDGTAGAWNFVPGEDDAGTPITMGADQDGLRVFVKDEATTYRWDGQSSPNAWVVDSGSIAIEEEGASVNSATTLDFKGPNVTASDAGGGQADIDVADDYDFGFYIKDAPSSGTIFHVPIGRDIRIPAGFSGSFGSVGTNPAAEWTAAIKDDGVQVGTVTVTTGGTVTITDGNSPAQVVDIAAGSVVTLEPNYASPPEASLADLRILILANRR